MKSEFFIQDMKLIKSKFVLLNTKKIKIMRNTLIITLALISSCFTFSQQMLVAVENLENKWGYATPSGNVVIKTTYIDAHTFMSGGAALVNVSKKDGWIVIDPTGKIISIGVSNFEPKTFLNWLSKGYDFDLQLIVANKKHGYLDSKGKLIVPCNYKNLSEFKDGFAIGEKDGDHYIISTTGEEVKVQVPSQKVAYMINGLAPFESNKLYGYINKNGEEVIEPKFKSVGYFGNEMAWAKTTDDLVGYINKKGDWLIQPQYQSGHEPDPIYNIARVVLNDETKYVLPTGQYLPVGTITAGGDFSEGFAWVRVGEFVGLIDHTGKMVIEPKYTKMERMTDGLINVREGSFWGAFDTNGKVAVPVEYEKINNLSDGLIAVRKNGLWGFVDKTGAVVIEPKFSGIRDFKNGYAAAKEGSTWGLVDKQGNWTIEPIYKRVKDVELIQ